MSLCLAAESGLKTADLLLLRHAAETFSFTAVRAMKRRRCKVMSEHWTASNAGIDTDGCKRICFVGFLLVMLEDPTTSQPLGGAALRECHRESELHPWKHLRLRQQFRVQFCGCCKDNCPLVLTDLEVHVSSLLAHRWTSFSQSHSPPAATFFCSFCFSDICPL